MTTASCVLMDSPVEGVRRVTLNRPDKPNAMTVDLVQGLYDALEEIAATSRAGSSS